ncbi:unnamed protein product [Cyprideis torosa]|uniref:Uncharacterized protein n=1 Tax=Cyprideis torosa TaxID=163714 RepID=A0A7R8WKA7_9CRUS|nr:unnamed protein product [Cyprideis torosa]CAG0902960.1 unnamed protein product [Cyprideis torosa]
MAGDAYRAVPILEKLPLQIESMVAFEPHPTNQACSALDHHGGAGSSSSKLHLIVGTKVGHLLMYEVDLRNPNERVQLLRSSKGFSKKSLTQLGVIPECGILLALSDSVITVHDMNVFNFPIITQLERTKGALLFAVDCKKQTSQTGVISTIVRLCVAVRKSLQLYYWKNRKFLELGEDLALPDFPKTISWCGESLFVGVRKEYFRLTITGRLYELFPVHSPNEPNILRLEDYKVALGQDNKLVILDSNGKPAKSNMLEWSNHPSALQFDPPFLVAVLPCYLEVRSLDPDVLMQTISLSEGSRSNRPRLLAWASVGHIFVASTSHIWCLEALPLHRQIPLLLENKEFELALKLNSMRSHPGVDQEKLYQSIQMLHAFDLFVRLKFKESLEVFHELGTDPSHVIGLFPGLLPQDFRSQLSYPGDLPQLSGMDLEDGLLALRDYLTQVRYKLLDESGSNNRSGKEKVRKLSSNPILEGAPTIKSRERMLQIIDTTLVKCFLATTDSLVASFLRLKDNHCHMEETELALKKHQKFDDLIILYQTKNQHRKALEILRSPLLKSTSKTVDYLQRIAKDHFELTLEFAEWVLKEDPEEGLRLFTEDLPEVECLPRAKVMSELEKRCPALVIRYLRHVIEVWQDQNQLLHDVLADRYLKEILDLISKPSSDPDQVDSSQKLCQFRHDFVEFLEASTRYSPEKILVKLPFDSFFEERAILYGKMEQHEKALAVYIYLLVPQQRPSGAGMTLVFREGIQRSVAASLSSLVCCSFMVVSFARLPSAPAGQRAASRDVRERQQKARKRPRDCELQRRARVTAAGGRYR